MKKIILLTIVSTIIGWNGLSAQTFFQGEKTIAARVSGLDLGFTKLNGEKMQTNFNLGFKGDYFVIDNLTVTAGVNYGYNAGDNRLFGEIGSKYYFWEYLYGGVFYQGLFDYRRINSAGKLEAGATIYIARNVFIEPALYFIRGERAIGVKEVTMYSQFGLVVSIGVNF